MYLVETEQPKKLKLPVNHFVIINVYNSVKQWFYIFSLLCCMLSSMLFRYAFSIETLLKQKIWRFFYIFRVIFYPDFRHAFWECMYTYMHLYHISCHKCRNTYYYCILHLYAAFSIVACTISNISKRSRSSCFLYLQLATYISQIYQQIP